MFRADPEVAQYAWLQTRRVAAMRDRYASQPFPTDLECSLRDPQREETVRDAELPQAQPSSSAR